MQKGTTQHGLKFRAVLPHPVGHILAMAHEWDLLPTWNRFCLDALKLAEPSLYESVLYGAQWMMRPFRPLQALFRARGYDLAEEHRSLLITIDNCEVDALPQGHPPLPPALASRRTVHILPGTCMKFRPLPAETPGATLRTQCDLVAMVDPHIPYVPAALVNFVLGVLGGCRVLGFSGFGCRV